jgi:hypothetical protein
MTFRTRTLLPVVFVAALLSGCAAKGTFPSLAPRPFELGKTDSPPPSAAVIPTPARPSDPALLGRVAALVRKAESGTEPFNIALSNARRAVGASGRSVGSEAWIAAQMAISRLERTQETAQSALADIDNEKRMVLMAGPSVDEADINTAASRIEAINSSQASSIKTLIQAISPRR